MEIDLQTKGSWASLDIQNPPNTRFFTSPPFHAPTVLFYFNHSGSVNRVFVVLRYTYPIGTTCISPTYHLPFLKLTVRSENRPSQKERIVSQPSIFRGCVSFREGIYHFYTFLWKAQKKTSYYHHFQKAPGWKHISPTKDAAQKNLCFPILCSPLNKKQPILAPPQKKSGNNNLLLPLHLFFRTVLPRSLVPTELPPNHPLLASCQAMERQKRFENLHQSEAEETETAKCPESFRMEPIGGGFKLFLCSPRKLGRISNLTIIFFRWVGPTTIQEPMCRFFLSVFLCQ